MPDHLSEQDEITLQVLAITERTTVAAQRRAAVREYASRARQDPAVAQITRLILASRRARDFGSGNVIRMAGGSRG